MNSTMVLSMDASGRTLWVDMGWPACDERLVTVAEANAHRVGGATTQLPDVRSAGRKPRVMADNWPVFRREHEQSCA
jgi:hypothetical protein